NWQSKKLRLPARKAAFSVSFPGPNCCVVKLTARSGWHRAARASTSRCPRVQSRPHRPRPRSPPVFRRRIGFLFSMTMTASCIRPPSAPTGRASLRRQTTRPPASGTPRAPRRSRSCAITTPRTPPPSAPTARSAPHATFLRDASRLFTASSDEAALTWDVAPATWAFVLRGHDDSVYSAAFSPDGSRIVTASNDNTARIWDAATATETAVLRGHDGPVDAAAVSPDGSRIDTASGDNTARIWDAATAKEIALLRGN